jgi:hypothetical protein
VQLLTKVLTNRARRPVTDLAHPIDADPRADWGGDQNLSARDRCCRAVIAGLLVGALMASGCDGDDSPPTTPSIDPPDAPGRADVAQSLAPLVYLAKDEPNLPAAASAFVDHSELWWDHRECERHLVEDDPQAAELADGGYSHSDDCDHDTTRSYRTNESGPDDAWHKGFFLNLDDPWRDEGSVPSPTYWQYYERGAGTGAYIYWLFYPYIDFLNRHEGDWERVAVRVVEDDEPTGMTYWHHRSSETCFLPWDEVEKAEEGHPVAYAATGSHGSYPTVGKQYRRWASDDQTSKGEQWSTWNSLELAKDQDWWGYRGLWGGVSNFLFYSGVVGPFPGRSLADAVTTDERCRAGQP